MSRVTPLHLLEARATTSPNLIRVPHQEANKDLRPLVIIPSPPFSGDAVGSEVGIIILLDPTEGAVASRLLFRR